VIDLVSRLAASGDRSRPLDRRNQAERLCHFGQALMKKREFAMALERFDAAIILRGDLAIAWAGRAEVLYCQKRYKAALQSLDRASQHLREKAPILLLAQAKVLCKLGLFEAAVTCCDDLLSLSPHDLPAHLYRIYALCKLGCYGELMPTGFAAPLLLSTVSQSCPINLQSSKVESVSV